MSEATRLLRELVNRLDFIHDHAAYRSVWTINQLHVGPYQGPTYEAELAAARAFLEAEEAEAPSGERLRSQRGKESEA